MQNAVRWAKAVLYWALGKSDPRYVLIKSQLVLLAARWGLYEREIYSQLPRLLTEGDVAVDVGANCGVYARRFMECVGRRGQVYAFEPNPSYGPFLRRISVNGRLVNVYDKAVSDERGILFLDVPRIEGGAPEPALASVGADGHGAMRVEAVTLDQALGTLERLDVLKIDVEGGEIAALRGATALLRRFRPAIIVETLEPARLSQFFEDEHLSYRYQYGGQWHALSHASHRTDATYVLRWQ